MHGKVRSQSFNGDSKALHYTVEWKDRMHADFHVFVTKCLFCPRLDYIILTSWQILMRQKYTRQIGPFPGEILVLSKEYSCNVQFTYCFPQLLSGKNISFVGQYFVMNLTLKKWRVYNSHSETMEIRSIIFDPTAITVLWMTPGISHEKLRCSTSRCKVGSWLYFACFE